MYLRCQIN